MYPDSDEEAPLLHSDYHKNIQYYSDDRNRHESSISLQSSRTIRVYRPVYQMDEFLQYTEYEKREPKSLTQIIHRKYKSFTCKNFFNRIFPITDWLLHYGFKKEFPLDLIAGTTVAILGIPQSIAYAILANVPPVVGLYTAFLPQLVYVIFATSKHNSVGTFAIICLMTGKIVLSVTEPINNVNVNAISMNTTNVTSGANYTSIEVAATVAFVTGCYLTVHDAADGVLEQPSHSEDEGLLGHALRASSSHGEAPTLIIMFLIGLGEISTFLSEHLIAGFTAAAACHVIVSQIPEVLGIKLPRRYGNFKLLYNIKDVADNLSGLNYWSISISIICLAILQINNHFKNRLKYPLPAELIIVIIFTCMSYFAELPKKNSLGIVGEIPEGLPNFQLPKFELIPEIALPTLALCFVSFMLTASMTKVLATKNYYEVNCNQECLALGMGNLVGSFFSCIPICASLSRSLVQEQAGGRTQIGSIIASIFTVFVILFLGKFLEPLPKCVLASIIIMALVKQLLQIKLIFTNWSLNKMDWLIFTTTFVFVTILEIGLGLLIGLAVAILALIAYGMKPHTCLMGQLRQTDIYLDTKTHLNVKEIPDIKIFHYAGGLSFAQVEGFKHNLYKSLKINPLKVARARKFELQSHGIYVKSTKLTSADEDFQYTRPECLIPFQIVIWDFSAVSYIDPAGVKLLTDIAKSFHNLHIVILMAAPSDPVFEVLKKCATLFEQDEKYLICPTIHDAVATARQLLKQRKSQ